MAGIQQVTTSTAGGWAAYLPLIAVVVGVVLGLLANTVFESIKSSAQHAHTARTIRKVLLEELRTALDSATQAAKRTNEAPRPGEGFFIPINERYHFYEASIAQLGVLESHEVAVVSSAYSYLYALPQFLAPLGMIRRHDDIVLAGFIPMDHRDNLNAIAEKMRTKIEAAVTTLEPRVRWDDLPLWRRVGHRSGLGVTAP